MRRITESLMLLLGIGLAIAYGLEEELASFVFVCLIIVDLYVGMLVEGLRFTQFIFLVAFIPHIVLVMLSVYNLIALVVYCCFLLASITLVLLFGMGDLSRFAITGPF